MQKVCQDRSWGRFAFDRSGKPWTITPTMHSPERLPRILWVTLLLLVASLAPAETFRVATYNVENYLDRATGTRKAKTVQSKTKIRENILSLKPDVLALQEMGTRSALRELQASLKADGLDLPHAEWITGWDTNIHLAVLSRFPLVRRIPHTNEAYLLSGRRLTVSRGFSEVEIEVDEDYRFTLINAHLKSKRPVGFADQAEMRLEEAKALRRIVDERLTTDPQANILVCGDFNDFFNAPPVKTLVGRGNTQFHDTRPAERNGDDQPNPRNPKWFPRNVSWTHHYGAEDTYSRLDYILLSPGMTREWEPVGTYALTAPNWGIGSDHRPILASFTADDR
jgi:endonuclease/exonuclease/phosphatase family metal-dependent hydrolase